ncbi:hypothetical protein DCAR_0624942 [Daucus carota subsp. sativus]|uniref:Uncharacterized protein n=1 Tax=Daucus carota subsp. sativus TaxID=79200 RepID=A0AAF1B463_DAUCS|nr:PREDICTED: putative pentatricopeptide repeat-containing protein At3g15930 [Daucus carota subsp. sativus]WOH05525.1 hypothetical protein DCAR_0624942 [Daucus carota subsp. sativus]
MAPVSPVYRSLKVRLHHFAKPTDPTSLFNGCNSMDQLKQIYLQIIQKGLSSDAMIFSKIVASCCVHESGCMDFARRVFETIPQPNVFIWNTMIKGYSQVKSPYFAISMYMKMLENNVEPDNYTFPFLLKCFTPGVAFSCGSQIHVHVCKFGFESNVAVQHALIHMYSLSKQLDMARGVFDVSLKGDVILWNAMISGYNRSKKFDESRKLFHLMEKRRVLPSTVTLVSVLSACSKLKDVDTGKRVHQYVTDHKVESSLTLENTLVDTYAACGEMDIALDIFKNMKKRDVISWTSIVTGLLNVERVELARKYFDQMPERDSISWTVMIDGYLKLNRFKEVLMLFREMQTAKVKADAYTMVSILTACAHLGALELGEWVKAYIDKNKIKNDVYVGNALIDMYFRCGDAEKAVEVFNEMQYRDKYTYTAMIVGYASNGRGEEALVAFDQMLQESVKPDEITCIGVLCACTHTGLVDEGRRFFSNMRAKYGIEPNVAHYGCMVDLLGRAGHIREAYEVSKNMPMKSNSVVWGALLAACRVYKNVEMAETAVRHLLQLEPENEAVYVISCNIYVVCNRLEDLKVLRKIMTDKGIKKIPGCSSIEVNGIIHEFVAGDRSHPQSEDICLKLENLKENLVLVGYTPEISEVFV